MRWKVRDEEFQAASKCTSMRNTGVFPNMVVQMTSIGEESGALDAMLDKTASYFEEEVDAAVDGMTAFDRALMMAFLGSWSA